MPHTKLEAMDYLKDRLDVIGHLYAATMVGSQKILHWVCPGTASYSRTREGLVKRQEKQVMAANECHNKTKRPHQMWTTETS